MGTIERSLMLNPCMALYRLSNSIETHISISSHETKKKLYNPSNSWSEELNKNNNGFLKNYMRCPHSESKIGEKTHSREGKNL